MANRYNKCDVPTGGTALNTRSDNGTNWQNGTTFDDATRITSFDGTNVPRAGGVQSSANKELLGPPAYLGDVNASIAGQTWTISAYVRRASGSGTVRLNIQFLDANRSTVGTITSGTAVTVPAASNNQQNVPRLSVRATAPSGATGFRVRVPSNGTALHQVGSVLYEQTSTVDEYFDGYSLLGAWDGTMELSTSTLYDVVERNSTDAFTYSELASSILATNDTSLDNFSGDDSSNLSVEINRAPTYNFTDASELFVDLNLTDSFAFVETSEVYQILFKDTTDNFSFTESQSSIYATGTSTDSFNYDENTSDLFGNLSTTDSLDFSDAVHHIAQFRSDSFILDESSVVDISVTDTFSFEDSYVYDIYAKLWRKEANINFDDGRFRVNNTPPVYDDQITYEKFFTKPRKPFRVIAQHMITKEFLHWDLPLHDEELSFRLSGPNSFTSELRTDVKDVRDVNPAIEADRTWLHVEENGQIRQSTVLMPFLDSNGNQTRRIEGVGFTDYANRRFYQGTPIAAVQIDPADIIRYIWYYLQMGKGENFGITLRPASLKTPVRLGTQPKNVDFQTSSGQSVDFESGPYDLNYWEVTNLGTEFNKLCKETPIEYIETSEWNSTKTDVNHIIDWGYPRIGRKRTDLSFREGENIAEAIPEYQSERIPRSVIIIGAGEGPTAIRGIASQNVDRMPYDVVLENEDITSLARANAIARFELQRRTKSRKQIKQIVVNTTHINALWGTFGQGDDILVEGTLRFAGKLSDYYRITEIVYRPRTRYADCAVSPSSQFSYGAVKEIESDNGFD